MVGSVEGVPARPNWAIKDSSGFFWKRMPAGEGRSAAAKMAKKKTGARVLVRDEQGVKRSWNIGGPRDLDLMSHHRAPPPEYWLWLAAIAVMLICLGICLHGPWIL